MFLEYENFKIDQKIAASFGLDIVDIMILAYIMNLPNTYEKSKKDENNKTQKYIRFNYKDFIEEYPILKIGKSNTISKRLWNMSKNGLILKHCERNGNGSTVYIGFTQKILKIFI